MRTLFRKVPLVLAVLLAILIPTQNAFADFTDVPSSYWDFDAITYVGLTNTWMQDYGKSTFKPTTDETREYAASALVKAYAPNEPVDPNITFPDLPSSDPFFPYANVAVKLGWIDTKGGGNFDPTSAISVQKFDKAIVVATGQFADAIKGLQKIHQDDGDAYSVGSYFAYMQLAHWLGLHYNHGDETMDLNKGDHIHRDEVAYSLWAAKTLPSWEVSDASKFNDISLPALDPNANQNQKDKQNVTDYALDQLGFPYVWAGEWNTKSPNGYCCGSQPIGGMDCSGFTWWTMKKVEGNYDAASKHPAYTGWSLPERSSSDMADKTPSHVRFGRLKIGDLMFFASDGGNNSSDVDHVGIYIGNNWMIHSTGSSDGVVVEWVGDGYYRDTFVWGRRLIGSAHDSAPGRYDPTAGDGPRSGGDPNDPRTR
jgi:cell wall-associated NlpC family hydrolase